jgi:nitronate monooxygenase
LTTILWNQGEMSLRTSLTKLIGSIKTPIVLGPMANAAGGELAGRVSRAGGLGFIGAGYYTPERLGEELRKAQEVLQGGGDQSADQGRTHIGVGFLAWRLTKLNEGKPSNVNTDSPALALIDEALKVKPIAIWLSFGDEEELTGWSKVVRQREAAINGAGKSADGKAMKLFIGVGNEQEARVGVEQCGADVLIIQGHEAGGHGLGSSPPLSAILPLLCTQIDSMRFTNPSDQRPPLLAAGGIMTGANLAGALAQGADGVVVGTRMLFTPEAAYSDAQKQLLVDAKPGSTMRTMAFDHARGTLGWPKGVDGRGITNETVKDFEAQAGDDEGRRRIYKEAESKGDTARIVTWAGTGVGLANEIKPAEDIVAEMTADAVKAVNRLSSFVVQ